MRARRTFQIVAALSTIGLMGIANGIPVHASSHREAPLIAQDPTADSTDLYSFVGTNDAGVKVLNVIANYIPFEEPAGGPNYYSFSDDVRYEIHIENDATMSGGAPVFSGHPNLSYYFNFKTNYKNPGTFLTYGVGTAVGAIQSVGDSHQNLTQSYTVTQVSKTGTAPATTSVLSAGQSLLVPPDNVGHATPLYDQNADPTKPAVQGATTTAQLDPYTRSTIYTLPGGIKVFAGQRLDSFYADIGALFDLLSVRNPAKNTFAGYNVHTIAMQIPVSLVATGSVPIVGVYTAASRRAVTILPDQTTHNQSSTDSFGRAPYENVAGIPNTGENCPPDTSAASRGAAPSTTCSGQLTPGSLGAVQSGAWTQVSRLGNPLDNEVMNGVGQKDLWGQTPPWQDSQFATNIDCPQLAGVFNIVLGTKLAKCGYSVLDSIFLPDLLKVDTSTGPVPLESAPTFSRLSVFGGDTVMSAFTGKPAASGWPNGRRLGDDVVDIAASAIASGPTLSPLVPVGDNVNSNGLPYNQVFPFMQTPANGFIHDHVYP